MTQIILTKNSNIEELGKKTIANQGEKLSFDRSDIVLFDKILKVANANNEGERYDYIVESRSGRVLVHFFACYIPFIKK